MTPALHLGSSQLTLLSLALLTSYPQPLSTLLPVAVLPELPLPPPAEDQRDDWPVRPDAWAQCSRDPLKPGEEEVLLRAQRGDLVARLMSPFPGGHSVEGYQEGGVAGSAGRKNEALVSIAGGLQAVSREKGGFGFRFGRKRWTGEGRDRAEQNE
uniref:Pyroglutamylated RFamide peptide n=1 Tax=Mola mola TaxID=94237 RepID=A0A3Q3X9E1_MOLML